MAVLAVSDLEAGPVAVGGRSSHRAAAKVANMMAGDPLSSWNDGPAKTAILDFVARVTEEGGADFVRPSERIATFDNDGTL